MDGHPGEGGHRRIEGRSLALHAAVAERLRADPSLLRRARERVAAWEQDATVAPTYASRWRAVLEQPLDDVCRFLVDPGEPARELRQASPFAGALPPRERWQVLRAAGAADGRPRP